MKKRTEERIYQGLLSVSEQGLIPNAETIEALADQVNRYIPGVEVAPSCEGLAPCIHNLLVIRD